jgi:hypothetical protein
MGSTEYDTVSERYVRFLRGEILPSSQPNTAGAKTLTAMP